MGFDMRLKNLFLKFLYTCAVSECIFGVNIIRIIKILHSSWNFLQQFSTKTLLPFWQTLLTHYFEGIGDILGPNLWSLIIPWQSLFPILYLRPTGPLFRNGS